MTEDYHLRYGKGILLVVDTTTMCSIWIEEILKGYCTTVALFLVSDIFPFIFMLERMYFLISEIIFFFIFSVIEVLDLPQNLPNPYGTLCMV